jgi:hypothetical protein
MGNVDSPDGMQASGLITIPTRAVTKISPLEERSSTSSLARSGERLSTQAASVRALDTSKRPVSGTSN